MIALIDNYDSFTFNVYNYLARHDRVQVFRNTESMDLITGIDLKGIVISPGPSHPASSLLSLEVLEFFKGKVPILGICLGMQAMAYQSGNRIRKAKRIMHGKIDTIAHSGGRLFEGMGPHFSAVRYHSLAVEIDRGGFEVCAVSMEDGEVMAIENRELAMFGLQFHPESYATQQGMMFITNFLEVCHGNA